MPDLFRSQLTSLTGARAWVRPMTRDQNSAIAAGDLIVALEDTPFTSSNDLILALECRKPGDMVRLILLREDQRVAVDVILDGPR